MKQLTCSQASLFLFLIFVLFNCTTKKSSDNGKTEEPTAGTVNYEVTPDKSVLAAYYKLDHIQEWYPERILPPAFDFDVDLTKKSIVELSLLRNEIFARNGYLFEDAVLRGYFNQFKWYQPIFDVPEFEVQLNEQEQAFVNKVLKLENELSIHRYVKQDQHEMIDLTHVHNLIQFKAIDNKLNESLAKKNFAIVPAKHEQLFHVYDNNHYEYIPNFITTDLYLQVLHKHFSTLLQKVEEDQFVPLMTTLLENLYTESRNFEAGLKDQKLIQAARWATTYLAIAHNLIRGRMESSEDQTVNEELQKIASAQGSGSSFLKSKFIQYSTFKARGNYTKSQVLENYFRCVKWLNTAPMLIQEDDQFSSAVLIASLIKKSPENLEQFQRFSNGIKLIVGDEDNLSIGNLIAMLPAAQTNDLASMNRPGDLDNLRKQIGSLNVNKIRPKGGDAWSTDLLDKEAILFTAGRYTFDAEILGRLIHVLRPEPKRPFPKGLDVFASLGNTNAENILLKEYREDIHWKNFSDSLQALKTQFAQFEDWDKNFYSKTFHTIVSLNNVQANVPLFMKHPAWSKKNLSTSLAAWTQLKHDMLLYAEQPFAAQAGEGGGPPPPMHISFVEPNVTFWEKALQLLDYQETQLASLDLLNDDIRSIIDDLTEIGELLLKVSKKQLAQEHVTREEFHDLSYLGGRIEYLTFKIFGSDHLPEKERLVAVVADVYNYNGKYLEEAVGMIDEIYVVAEINGKAYLTKGAVFSYYEFTNDSPLTDEEWRSRVTAGNAPDRPLWLNEIMVEAASLESKPTYSF
jgi:hypothetical protein